MRIFFGAQGSILRTFCELDRRLRSLGTIHASAYWISDSEFYFQERKRSSLLSDPEIVQLFEWEYTATSGRLRISAERKHELERRYQGLGLWNAIVVDRRLMYGAVSKVRQSYAGRFDDEALSCIIYNTLDALDKHAKEFRPDAIVTFVPASYGDYLLALVAQFHGIRYLQLRSTKIQNYVIFADSLGAVSDDAEKAYHRNIALDSKYPFEHEAHAFLEEASSRPIDYEGTLSRNKPSFLKELKGGARQLASALKKAILPVHPIVRRDNHVPPPLATWLHGTLFQPWYRHTAFRLMRRRLVTLQQANTEPYVFYPLHSEPEIALSLYGRDHQNQIETVRRLAQSLPLGWKLIVKEHPRSLGYRSRGWYLRLLEIPNVYFADPDIRPFYWIEKAKAVVTVSGFVGFEALVIGKPVVVLGSVAFSMLPDTMLRSVASMSDFGRHLLELIENFSNDRLALQAFVAACMSEGTAVNLYSDLLAKPGRNKTDAGNSETQLNGLTELLIKRLNSVTPRTPALSTPQDYA
jgi:hypothetical protein